MSKRSRNAEGEVGERHDRVAEYDMSHQMFNHARRVVVLLLALSHLTEIGNFLLRGRAAETRRIDSKVSLQVYSFKETLLPRGNQDLGSEVHRSGQRRAICRGD